MPEWNQSPGGAPPSLDEVLEKITQRLKGFGLKGFKGSPVLILVAVVVVQRHFLSRRESRDAGRERDRPTDLLADQERGLHAVAPLHGCELRLLSEYCFGHGASARDLVCQSQF